MEEERIIPLKYRSLSIVVLVILLLLAFENYQIWAQAIERVPKPQKEEAKPSPSTQPHSSIAERNIFSPDRKDFPAPGVTSKPIVRPQVVLYGVTIAGDYQAASVSNPGRPLQKGERETFTTRVGEKIGDYKVANISFDRITLEVDGDRFDVLLYDSTRPKKRIEVKTETKPATITSTLPAPPTPAPATPTPSTPPVSTQVPKPSTPPAAVTPSPPATATPAPPATKAPTAYPPGVRRGRTPYYPSPGTSGSTTQGTGGN